MAGKVGSVAAALEPIKVLSPLVTRVLGCNPGPYTLSGTNTYLIGRGPFRVLFDTGQGLPEYIDLLEEAMKQVGCKGLQAIIVSHWHHDHIGGVPDVQKRFGPDIPTLKFMPETLDSPYRGEGAIDPYSVWPKDQFQPILDGQTLETEGATLKFHYTPGHANDHVVMTLEEEQSMFTADNVLGQGTAVFRNLTQYMSSLERMLKLGPKCLYPGHGPMVEDGCAMIAQYMNHRNERVQQVEQALTRTSAIEVEEIAKRIYPAELPETLFLAACSNTKMVLEYLRNKGTASETEDGKWQLPVGSNI
mmetsp:Transcript_10934/g.20244  ORF Transcript_10934/g.20244 Transcript_10934/m.20244 type:complete len:304 (+) Transcript_10934:169-1080(+)